MSMRKWETFHALGSVGSEFEAGRFALSQTLRALEADGDVVQAAAGEDVAQGDVWRCRANMQITYVIRLFAEFEGILLDFWHDGLKRRTTPKVKVVMDRVADLRGMSPAHRTAAHDVREYRNEIIHERLRTARLPFHECKSQLGRFVNWLPEAW